MIYLSWSITHLATVILIWAVLSALVIWKTKGIKGMMAAALLWLLVMFYMALDITNKEEKRVDVPVKIVQSKVVTFQQAVKITE